MHAAAHRWALVLGGSSGMGLATARRFRSDGASVCVLHRDRKGSMPRVEADFAPLREGPGRFVAMNVDALDHEVGRSVLLSLAELMGADGRVKTLLHSVALGNLRPLVAPPGADPDMPVLDEEDMARTIRSMGTNLLWWVQALHRARLFADDARVFGLTSEGNAVAWPGYAAVSAAKLAMEATVRAIAVEFGPHGIRCNVLQPGVTDTRALRLIPGHEAMIANALRRNPLGRLTRPDDVAAIVALLSRDDAGWINGATIRIDGGEHIAAAE